MELKIYAIDTLRFVPGRYGKVTTAISYVANPSEWPLWRMSSDLDLPHFAGSRDRPPVRSLTTAAVRKTALWSARSDGAPASEERNSPLGESRCRVTPA